MAVKGVGIIGLTLLALVALAACGGTSPKPDPTPTATPSPAPTPTPTPIPITEIPLAETHVITGFGFSIDYPSGWLAETRETVTFINELENDHVRALRGERGHMNGSSVGLDHRGLDFMSNLGLPENPSLEDLLKLNTGFFDWPEPIEVSETVIFGVPALKANTHDRNNNWGVSIMGFLADEAFLLSIEAPSKEALAKFMPTWTRMLESIENLPQ